VTKHERHNPTPAERDEKFSLYGIDPEKVGEALLQPSKDEEPATKPKRRRRAKEQR